MHYLIDPGTQGARGLREFIGKAGMRVWLMTDSSLARALSLMDEYDDHPMDFADASLVAAAEALRTTKVFTLDRNDFATYRARIGRSLKRFVVPKTEA